jgi:hypothetical protein
MLKINPERNAVFSKAELWTVFNCGGCEYQAFYPQGEGSDKGNAVDAAFKRGWRVVKEPGSRVTGTLLCNQCFASQNRDVRPALQSLKTECEALCKCFCHTRDGLTICPDCEAVHNSWEYEMRCKVCGFDKVYVRGQYPKTDNRLICPQCVQELYDDLTTASGSGQNVAQ